jgi:hypothetical protein
MAFPPGHFYSPEIDREALAAERDRVWPPPSLEGVPGVALDLDGQRRLLERLSRFSGGFEDLVAGDATGPRFEDENPFFSGLDSRMLFAMLRFLAPRRMIEVGSGHSSLLAAAVNRRFLGGEMELTCIDPFPRDFLRSGVQGITTLVERRAELVGVAPFLALRRHDVLFIDSSHVVKTGNDVAFLYLQVLPRLAPGVVVHVHDIFLPDEYPQSWVLGEGRSWNEQYLLQALLVDSHGYRILFGSHCASLWLADAVESSFGGRFGGGSLWLERTGART